MFQRLHQSALEKEKENFTQVERSTGEFNAAGDLGGASAALGSPLSRALICSSC